MKRLPLLQSFGNQPLLTGLMHGAMTDLYHRTRQTPQGTQLGVSFTLAGHRFHPEAP